ncbi:phage holin family protein, partial [Chloroflexota bacterium]
MKPSLIKNLLIRFIINAAAIYMAALIIPGIHLAGWNAILLVAVIFGLVNTIIKPLVSFLTCLIQIITLGLFTLIINAGM